MYQTCPPLALRANPNALNSVALNHEFFIPLVQVQVLISTFSSSVGTTCQSSWTSHFNPNSKMHVSTPIANQLYQFLIFVIMFLRSGLPLGLPVSGPRQHSNLLHMRHRVIMLPFFIYFTLSSRIVMTSQPFPPWHLYSDLPVWVLSSGWRQLRFRASTSFNRLPAGLVDDRGLAPSFFLI
jgi:hypothetical protein